MTVTSPSADSSEFACVSLSSSLAQIVSRVPSLSKQVCNSPLNAFTGAGHNDAFVFGS